MSKRRHCPHVIAPILQNFLRDWGLWDSVINAGKPDFIVQWRILINFCHNRSWRFTCFYLSLYCNSVAAAPGPLTPLPQSAAPARRTGIRFWLPQMLRNVSPVLGLHRNQQHQREAACCCLGTGVKTSREGVKAGRSRSKDSLCNLSKKLVKIKIN